MQLAFLFAFGAVLMWSLNSLLMQGALNDTHELVHLLVRTASGSVLLLILLFVRSDSNPFILKPDLLFYASLTGFFSFFVAYSLFSYAIKHGLVHQVWPVGNSAPLWSTISAIVILGEDPAPMVLVAAFVVVFGIFFLSPRREEEGSTGSWRTLLSAFIAALIWGILIAPNKYCLNNGMDVVTFIVIAGLSGTVGAAIAMLFRSKNDDFYFTKKGIYLSFLSGLMSVFLGNLFWQQGLKIGKASVLAPIIGAETPLVFLLSAVFLKEKVTPRSIFGTILVSIGVFLATTVS